MLSRLKHLVLPGGCVLVGPVRGRREVEEVDDAEVEKSTLGAVSGISESVLAAGSAETHARLVPDVGNPAGRELAAGR